MRSFRITAYLKGYITVRVEGMYPEKFLNMAVASGVYFWDVKRLGITELKLKLKIRSYKTLQSISRRTGCRTYIIDKQGFPFSLHRLRVRKMMGIGLAIFILLIFMLSSFIWSIEITGTKNVTNAEVQKNLQELGVRPGALKRGLAVADIEEKMLSKMDSLAWIKIKLVGTRAEVEIVERVPSPRMIPEERACDIVAARDGLIIKIIASKGDALVLPGETVSKGQKLVSGVIERDNAEIRYVHSSAEIKARTWYEKRAEVPFSTTKKVRTGNIKSRIFLSIGAKTYAIKNPDIPYKNYDKIDKSIVPIDTGKFQLPVMIRIESYHETEDMAVALSAEEAKSAAIDEVEKAIADSMPSDAKIINKRISASVGDGSASAYGFVETVEDIGAVKEIK